MFSFQDPLKDNEIRRSLRCSKGFINVGVGVYNTLLKDVPLRKMFLWTAILGAALGSTQLILITGKLA